MRSKIFAAQERWSRMEMGKMVGKVIGKMEKVAVKINRNGEINY